MIPSAIADKRPPRLNPAWDEVQQNDLGIDEYMVLNKLLNMEPYICVNAGFGDAHSAAEEVEYVNGSVNTPMGKWRAANGHPEPYKVTWWNIGNEMWNAAQMGFMSANQYWIKHNMFAQAMRAVDPSIKLVTSGGSPVETGQEPTPRSHSPENTMLPSAARRTSPARCWPTPRITSMRPPNTSTPTWRTWPSMPRSKTT